MESILNEDGISSKLLELSPTGIVVINKAGLITYANKEAEKTLGLAKTDISQLTYNAPQWKITDFEGNSFPDEKLPFSQVMKSGKSVYNVQHAIEWPDGRKVYLSINAAPLKEDKNDPGGIIATVSDITDRVLTEEELKASERRFKDLFENLIDEVHIWKLVRDEEGNILTWELVDVNPAALKFWGKTREEVIGKPTSEIFDYDAEEKFMPIIKDIFETGLAVRWETYFPPTGQFLSMDSIPLGDYFISTGRDITEKRVAAAELFSAKEKALAANNLKTEFLHNMSHEIRTPLNGILGFSEIINNPGLSEEKRKYFSQIIQNSSHQLLKMIDDILEISSLETNQVTPDETEFSMNDFLSELYSIFLSKVDDSKISVHVKKALPDDESYIISDREKLNKILISILENSFKFTKEGFVEFGYTIEKDLLKFYVQDTGIGISPENHQIIFERFSQEYKDETGKFGGLGLGLSISKENVKLLGGDITLESEKGKGSTFYVTIPYNPGKI